MTDDDPTAEVDLYDLRPSGVVWVTLAGERRTIPRPTFGAFRKLKEAHEDADLRIVAKGQEIRAEQVEVSAQIALHQARLIPAVRRQQRIHALGQIEDRDPIEADELARLEKAEELGPPDEGETRAFVAQQARTLALLRELDYAAMDEWGQWLADTFTDLGVPTTVDDLDPSLCTARFTVDLIAHWRSLPPPRGR